MKKVKIAVIGANGYVGSHVCKEINKRNLHLIKVTRKDNYENKILNSDYIIHCANSGKRYFCNNNPEIDFNETVIKTYNFIKLNKNKSKFILISSLSARTQLDTFYGINRRAAEMLINTKKFLIIRLGPIFGGGKNVGPLVDILNNKKVYISSSTNSAYANISYYAKKIIDLIDSKGIIELGAKDYINLGSFKKMCNSKSKFLGKDDTQIPLSSQDDSPSVTEVYKYFKLKK